MLRALTDPSVVSKCILPPEWSPEGIVTEVAKLSPLPHALIDAGALITGLDNEQVASRLLASLPPSRFDGVVFLQPGGHKRILLRTGEGAMDLERCGVPKERRFSFYDQVRVRVQDVHVDATHATRRDAPSADLASSLALFLMLPLLCPCSHRFTRRARTSLRLPPPRQCSPSPPI